MILSNFENDKEILTDSLLDNKKCQHSIDDKVLSGQYNMNLSTESFNIGTTQADTGVSTQTSSTDATQADTSASTQTYGTDTTQADAGASTQTCDTDSTQTAASSTQTCGTDTTQADTGASTQTYGTDTAQGDTSASTQTCDTDTTQADTGAPTQTCSTDTAQGDTSASTQTCGTDTTQADAGAPTQTCGSDTTQADTGASTQTCGTDTAQGDTSKSTQDSHSTTQDDDSKGKSSFFDGTDSPFDADKYNGHKSLFKQRMADLNFIKAALGVIIALPCDDDTCEMIKNKILSAILLLAGTDFSKITEVTGLHKSALYSLRNQIFTVNRLDDLQSLFVIKTGRGRKSPLREHEDEIVDMVENGSFHSLIEIINSIEKCFGFKANRKALSRMLIRHEIRKYKCGSLPANADPEKQKEFYENVLLPLIERAKREDCVLLFSDASHFVIGGEYSNSIYGSKRRFIRTFSGRKRYNVLGALNFLTHEITTITNDTTVNALTVIELLDEVARRYAPNDVYLVLDNARYQHCQLVTSYAKCIGINLIFLPPYSPNLNLIERLWKFVKTALRCTFYKNFKDFRKKIDEILVNATTTNRKQLDSLLSENFQLYTNYTKLNENVYLCPPYESKRCENKAA